MRRLVLLGAGLAVVLAVILAGAAFLIAVFINDPADELISRAEQLLNGSRSGPGEDIDEKGRIERLEEAADLYGQVALVAPESRKAPEALFKMGLTYYVQILPKVPEHERSEKLKMAEDAFLQIIERYPESAHVIQAHKYLGEIYIAFAASPLVMRPEEHYRKALQHYDSIVGRIEDPVERQGINYNMALCHERLGSYDQAIRCLKDIINLSLEGRYFENAHLMLARYYAEAGLHDKATEQLKQLLTHSVSNPTRQVANIRLVESLLQLERFDEARAALEEVDENASNRALIADYKDRIRRWSLEGK